jgi:hypothetical protein
MKILASGEKSIIVQLTGARLFLRLHVFLFLNHFLVEGMPQYSPFDSDLPSGYQDDPENTPPLKF